MDLKKPALGPIALNVAVGAFLLCLMIGGGSSRADVPALLFVRLAAVAILALMLFSADLRNFRLAYGPILFIGCIWALMLVQLVPLPPSIWQGLPGREFYAEAAAAAGEDQPWRPISLAPDLTIEAMLGWLPATATALLFAFGPARFRTNALGLLAGIVILSALLAVFQLAGGEDTPLRFYRPTNVDSGVGLLANRNHQALLMAIGIPVAACLAVSPGKTSMSLPIRLVVAGAAILVCIVGALLTGSRSGMVLVGCGMISVVPILWSALARLPRLVQIPAVLAGAAAALIGVWLIPAERLSMSLLSQDGRTERIWPTTMEALTQFFPLGSGFGTFERVYPRFEPLSDLRPTYANKAHSDLLEIGLEAGIIGYLFMAIFFVWFLRAAFDLWRTPSRGLPSRLAGRAGSIIILLGVLASVTDYPLRTPLLGSIFVVGAMLLHCARFELRSSRSLA